MAAISASAEAISRAAALLRAADAVLVTAGAGLGVDSGLPDFRGTEVCGAVVSCGVHGLAWVVPLSLLC
jgi:hypothetical protein